MPLDQQSEPPSGGIEDERRTSQSSQEEAILFAHVFISCAGTGHHRSGTRNANNPNRPSRGHPSASIAYTCLHSHNQSRCSRTRSGDHVQPPRNSESRRHDLRAEAGRRGDRSSQRNRRRQREAATNQTATANRASHEQRRLPANYFY